MDGFDAQMYESLKTRIADVGLLLEIRGENFYLYKPGGLLGAFSNLERLQNYVWGYECGIQSCRNNA